MAKKTTCFLLKVIFFFLLFLLQNSLFAFNKSSKNYQQWFTGPVLTPTPITMPVDHPGLEVAWLVGQTHGFYNSSWQVEKQPKIVSIGPYVDFQVGFNEILGAEYIGALLTNFSEGSQFTHMIDSIFRFGFQISNDQKKSWIPDFRVLIQETVPTGKFDKLSPKKNRADATGLGSFQTGVHLAFQKLFHPKKNHDLRLRWTFGYFFPAPFNVVGLNLFGGDETTSGTIYLGDYFSGFLCGEYALSRTWALCIESNYQFGSAGRFSKISGPQIDVPSYSQISIAPQIQHTLSPQLGVLMGAWFTVAGRNSFAFTNYFVSFLYSF